MVGPKKKTRSFERLNRELGKEVSQPVSAALETLEFFLGHVRLKNTAHTSAA